MQNRRKAKRRRVLLVAIVLIVLLALALAAFFVLRSPSSDNGTNDNSTEQLQANDVAEKQASESKTASADLSARDKDFAVDPNRREWNYDGVDRKVIYLTIDDGPSENTSKVLDILDAYNAKATFFVVGHNPEFFPVIKDAYERGNTIGLHTNSHDYAYLYSSQAAYFDDLDGIGNIVKEQIGFVPCFIRFPGGSSNMVSSEYSQGIMTALVGEVQERGFQYYDWNVSSGDGADHTADELVDNATVGATEYQNIMLLMHDSATKGTSAEALPRIIEYWQAKGYTFEAINRESLVVHHGVSN